MIREIKLIYSDDERVGSGTKKEPIRRLYKIVTHKGDLIASYDPLSENNYINLEKIRSITL